MRSKFKWIFTLFMALTMQFSFAQEKTVTGTVSDSKATLPMANVKVKGTNNGVQADMEGNFSIKAKVGDVLVVSFAGYESKEVKVGAANSYKVSLKEEAQVLKEVVVQGYKTIAKEKAVSSSASVSSKTIENRPNANVMNTLQGQLAGVNITAGTGQPGAKSTVIIRGLGTINGNSDPLYVIDGFPTNADNFRSINPNDISNVEVLKDAAAVAEYGSRGANGVVVIKTKKGSFGQDAKTSFRYTSQIGMTELQTPRYNYANSRELLTIEKNYGVGRGSTLTDAEIAAYNVNTDWVNYFFRKGTSVSHNLAIENSAKNINSFTSVGYFDQQGVLNTTGLKRFTLRNNINGKSNNEKFNYSVNTALGFSKNNEATNLGGGAVNRNYALGAYASVPYVSPDEYQNSQQLFDLYQADGTLLYTPLFLVDKLKTYTNLTDEMRMNVSTEYSYKLLKDLTLRGRSSGELLTTRFQQSEHPISFNAFLFLAAGQQYGGFEDTNARREFRYNQLWQVDYSKSFGKHTVDADLNIEYNHSRVQTNNMRQRGLNPQTFVPGTGAGYLTDTAANDFYAPQISASNLRLNMISYFGSLSYDYDSKYGLAASIRKDQSSRFLKTNNASNFWSLGGRWNLDKEGFIKNNLKFVNMLKLRGSIGTVGNQRVVDGTEYAGIIPPGFADIYSLANNVYNSGTGYGISFGYPNLRWETTKQSNIGFDFEMFNRRFRGTFDYYNKKTTDLYLGKPVSPYVGTTSITQNTDAYVLNKGVELNLAYDLIKKDDMTLTLRGNGSYNRNLVGGLPGTGKIQVGTQPVYVTQNGGLIDEPVVYHYVGVNQSNGNMLFQAADGTITETPQATDAVASGKNRIPVYQGGFGFDFDYKGFFTSATFTYAFRVWRYDYDYQNLFDPTNLGQFTVGSELLNAWTPTNTNTDVPSLTASNYGAVDNSDKFLMDASYVRLRNLQLGYRLPKKLIEKTFMKDVSIMVQGENIFKITRWKGFDPESDRDADVYGYPTPRIYTLSLDIKF
ncbi:SusC/RagA family TonB-linked outer membrane protein [Flavobacterium sp. N1719]|uniref:SusC/RagA family TonB-linked outer membrane protein n=1 Tax=Flavobacterium sp. N1719 TaxID=2885633 RepID=UPI0022221C2C|nr:SusC/RagA family TonB-linked outer membrane protein [Flavobacterium sp. N1719]